jgi:hypothetical protein
MRSVYEEWCDQHGEKPIGGKALSQALQRVGVQKARTKADRFYRGVTVTRGDR